MGNIFLLTDEPSSKTLARFTGSFAQGKAKITIVVEYETDSYEFGHDCRELQAILDAQKAAKASARAQAKKPAKPRQKKLGQDRRLALPAPEDF